MKGLIWVSGLSCSVCGGLWGGVSPNKRRVPHTIPSSLQMPVWCLRIQINSNPLPRWACLMAQMVKNLICNAGDPGSIPGSERSPGEKNGNPLQYLSREIPGIEKPGGPQSMGSQRVRHD